MNNIRLETLTPVHIGSGNELARDIDFFVPTEDNEFDDIYVIDPDRIAQDMGGDKNTFAQWAAAIEQGRAVSFLNRFLKPDKRDTYTRRRLERVGRNDGEVTVIKECMHDGQGRAYIPGSSLKGALRTALLTHLIQQKSQAEQNRLLSSAFDDNKNVEDEILGKMNESLMRFLRVGDTVFGDDCCIAIRQKMLNERFNNPKLMDNKCQSVVEAIGSSAYHGKKPTCSIVVKGELQRRLAGDGDALAALLRIANDHTRQLLQQEIDYYKTVAERKIVPKKFIENMEKLLEKVDACNPGSCVLRVGQGSGWRFMTGAWTEELDRFEDVIYRSRPGNAYKYSDYDFPKTRRISSECVLFGFVRLTIINQNKQQ